MRKFGKLETRYVGLKKQITKICKLYENWCKPFFCRIDNFKNISLYIEWCIGKWPGLLQNYKKWYLKIFFALSHRFLDFGDTSLLPFLCPNWALGTLKHRTKAVYWLCFRIICTQSHGDVILTLTINPIFFINAGANNCK